ncbi:MAG: hypothetical protein MUO73_05240 [Thermoplasmata archaeon]|nr:hypothetical protein [Thermoplasmata archaeon]
MKISFLVFLIIGWIIVILIGVYASSFFDNPETVTKFIKQKEVDCNICLESQYARCYTLDNYCWVLIDNIHQACYQNCTMNLED